MKTIKLYGHLGKQFGKIHRYMVETPSEAIRLLSANYKGFEKALLDFKGAGYRVITGNEDCNVEGLHCKTGQEVIKIIPVISGAGDSSLNMIILGAILVFAAPWAAFAIGSAAGAGTASYAAASILGSSAVAYMGTALIYAGIASALYSPPPVAEQAKLSTSGYFEGAVNTSRQGLPIPLGYGELIVGSAVISAGISTVPA